MAGIIWLASYPKSGNTWARMFVENLLLDSERAADINARKLFGVGEASLSWWRQVTDQPVDKLEPRRLAALRPQVHRLLSGLSSDNVLVKTHNALIEYFGVPLITAEVTAGAVYIVRNPLDVCLSFADHFGVSADRATRMMAEETMVTPTDREHAFECLSSWSTHVQSWTATPHPQLLVVRYEDLAAAPLESFGAIARHLGHAPTPERLQQAIANCSFEELRKQEEERDFKERSKKARRFFRAGRSGQWREQLSKLQVHRIVQTHGVAMRRFGYLDAAGTPV